MSDSPEGWMNIMEVADFLPMHYQSVRRLIYQGKLPSLLVHGKRLIRREVAESFREAYRAHPAVQANGHGKGVRTHEVRLL